jgi:hypothetical protein
VLALSLSDVAGSEFQRRWRENQVDLVSTVVSLVGCW